jgi:hypothetical protein
VKETLSQYAFTTRAAVSEYSHHRAKIADDQVAPPCAREVSLMMGGANLCGRRLLAHKLGPRPSPLSDT